MRIDRSRRTRSQPAVGLTFANALHAFLRQDPDVIMVGEIAILSHTVAIQASLLGVSFSRHSSTHAAPRPSPALLISGSNRPLEHEPAIDRC